MGPATSPPTQPTQRGPVQVARSTSARRHSSCCTRHSGAKDGGSSDAIAGAGKRGRTDAVGEGQKRSKEKGLTSVSCPYMCLLLGEKLDVMKDWWFHLFYTWYFLAFTLVALTACFFGGLRYPSFLSTHHGRHGRKEESRIPLPARPRAALRHLLDIHDPPCLVPLSHCRRVLVDAYMPASECIHAW